MLKRILRYIRFIRNRKFYSEINDNIQEIRYFDGLSYKEKISCQHAKVISILATAQANCPYYSQFTINNKLSLENIPILTKKIIRNERSRLLNKSVLKNAKKNTSGGTTGEPVSIFQCDNYLHWNHAYTEFYYEKASNIRYKKYRIAKLWGSERDIIEGSETFRKRLWMYLDNMIFLNSFRMAKQQMNEFIVLLDKFSPHILEAYAQSAYEFAKFLNRKKKRIFGLKAIITSAGTLDRAMELTIKSAFPDAKILNRYGSREVGPIACSCNGRKWLHVSLLSHAIEIVDDSGKTVNDGEAGRIVVTSLTNRVMPIIRYDIGDRGILRREWQCPNCGWQGDIIEKITGRTVDVFKSADGAIVDGEFFTHLFYFKDWVEKFQIIQHDLYRIEINIVLRTGCNEIPNADKTDIELVIKRLIDAEIRWNIVRSITTDKSGKIRFTISNVR